MENYDTIGNNRFSCNFSYREPFLVLFFKCSTIGN